MNDLIFFVVIGAGILVGLAIKKIIQGEQTAQREREYRIHCKNKEYLEKNPIPYAIAELVPNSMFLITISYPSEKLIDEDIDKKALLLMGVAELKRKFEILIITQKYIDENRMEVSRLFGGEPALYVWVKPKS